MDAKCTQHLVKIADNRATVCASSAMNPRVLKTGSVEATLWVRDQLPRIFSQGGHGPLPDTGMETNIVPGSSEKGGNSDSIDEESNLGLSGL
jgi:hypothetical protein